jgi:hypothetical protein
MIYRSYWCINETVFLIRYVAEENVHDLYITNEHDRFLVFSAKIRRKSGMCCVGGHVSGTLILRVSTKIVTDFESSDNNKANALEVFLGGHFPICYMRKDIEALRN